MDIFEISRSEPQTHIFTTDNYYFNSIGLGAFTTGILYEYFNDLDTNGVYENRNGALRDIQRINDVLGFSLGDPDWGSWEGFRKLEITGKYEKQLYNSWLLNEFGQQKSYQYSDLGFSDFSTTDEGIPNKSSLDSDGFKLERTGFFFLNSFNNSVNPSQELKDAGKFLIGSDMLNIIAMNDFMIDVKRKKPRSEWKDLPDNADLEYVSKERLFAIDEYLTDIKSSKYGGVLGSGLVTFNIEMAGGQFKCPVTEWVQYELKLRDEPSKLRAKPAVIPNNQLVADYKKDEVQRFYKSSVDGEIETPDRNQPNQKTVAPMELSYNTYKNKWQSGTASIMAMLAEPFPAAPYKPDFDFLANGDVKSMINSVDETSKITFTSGIAMPIAMQNGNPYQWSPNYATDKNCRDNNLTKQTVRAFNFNPKKGYEKGDMVILSEIGGVWHIIDPGIGDDADRARPAKPRWNFSYHMTSRDYFFKALKRGTRNDIIPTTPSYLERLHHKIYYKYDSKNGGGREAIQENGKTYNSQFSTEGINDILEHPKGCFQITSFDFMDKLLFGTRAKSETNPAGMNKNGLNTTLATEDAQGRAIPLGNAVRNAAHSGPFFGAVFPDGYNTSPELVSADREFNILYHNSGAPDIFQAQGENATRFDILTNVGQTFFMDFEGPNFSPQQHPFIDPKSDVQKDSVQGLAALQAGILGVRSDARSAVNAWGDEEFPEDESWFRYSFKQGPSMFHQFTDGISQDLRQLPADIGTNAHISSDNGSPLYDIHRNDDLYLNYDIPIASLQREYDRQAFVKCSWLRKQDLEVDGTDYSPESSAFGFQPKNPFKIQFRPLKMETYAMFNDKLRKPADMVSGPNYARRIADARALKSLPGKETEWDKNYPADRGGDLVTPDRYLEVESDPNSLRYRGLPQGWKDVDQETRRASWGAVFARHTASEYLPVDVDYLMTREDAKGCVLQSNDGDPETSFGFLPFMIGEMRTEIGRNNGDRYHNRDYWYDKNYDRGNNNTTNDGNDFFWQDAPAKTHGYPVAGGSAIGVVSACTTVSATNAIVFDTTNYFGMESVFWPTVPKEAASWGGQDNRYDGYNTYHLAVTIYQQHPRKQTIHDTTYFAVHHYNPNPELEGLWTGANNTDYYERYEEQGAAPGYNDSDKYAWPNYAEVKLGEISVTYAVDISGDTEEFIPSVAIREPSIAIADGAPTPLSEDALIFKDGTRHEGDLYQLVPEQYSHLNTTRIGKLLPYTYKYYGVTFPTIQTTTISNRRVFELGFNRPENIILSEQLADDGELVGDLSDQYDVNIVLVDTGTGYQLGDTVGDPDTGLVFRVEGIGTFNTITRLSFSTDETLWPENLEVDPSRLLNTTSEISPETTGVGVQIKTINSEEGEDFQMYIISGRVGAIYKTDQKPRYITREQQISADADNTPTDRDTQEFGFVTEDVTTRIEVLSEISSNNQYDCFFQAHNDTLFTFFSGQEQAGYYNGIAQASPVDEQYIELTILPE